MITHRQNGDLILGVRFAGVAGACRLADAPIEPARRAEILARARAGQVDKPIEFDARVYRQTRGQPLTAGRRSMKMNILIRPGAMRAFTRTFRGRPFLGGHDWASPLAAGGTITDSWLDETSPLALAEGAHPTMSMSESIHASEPWSVAGVLGGQIREFSIGFVPTGDVLCSVHEGSIRDCPCWPGDLVGNAPGPGQPDTRTMAQWLIDAAEGVETSAVNVPAVGAGATGIDAIRLGLGPTGLTVDDLPQWRDATGRVERIDLDHLEPLADAIALAAALGRPGIREAMAQRRRGVYDGTQEAARGRRSNPPMSLYHKLAAALALAVTADAPLDEDRAVAAAEALRAQRDLFRARAERAESTLAEQAQAEAAREIDQVIAAAESEGKLAATVAADGRTRVPDPQEVSLRKIAAGLGLAALKEHIAAMPAQRPPRAISTSERTPAVTRSGGGLTAAMKLAAKQCGQSEDDVLETAIATGRA